MKKVLYPLSFNEEPCLCLRLYSMDMYRRYTQVKHYSKKTLNNVFLICINVLTDCIDFLINRTIV